MTKPLTLAAVDTVLREHYEPAIREQAAKHLDGPLARMLWARDVTDEERAAWREFCATAPIRDVLDAWGAPR